MSPRISDIDINTIAYWDGIYRTGEFPTLAQNNLDRYAVAASLQIGETALDIGCGQGGVGLALSEINPNINYIGIDFSQAAIDNTVFPGGEYHCVDWQDVDMGQVADTVYILEIIEHVDDPAELIAKAASLARIRLVVGTPRYELITLELHRGEHMWDFTDDELIALLEPHGTVGEIMRSGAECCAVSVTIPQSMQDSIWHMSDFI